MPSKDLPQNHTGNTNPEQIIQQCNALAQRRQYRQALALCRRHLTNRPDSPGLLNLAGTMAFHDGQLGEAEDLFRRAARLAPRQALIHVNLANALKRSGNIDGAVAAYQTALHLAPNDQQVLIELGALYADSGDARAAAQTYERLLNLNPDHPAALNYLETFYTDFLQEHADHTTALKNLGVVLIQRGKLDQAKAYLCRANDLDPDDVGITSYLARVYLLSGDVEKAEHLYRDAISHAPDDACLHYDLGITLNSQGRTEEAIACIRTSIRLDPGYEHAHEQLARIKKHREYDDDIRAMEEVLKRPNLTLLQKSQLNFGLGKAYEDLQEYDRAFDHYKAANDQKRNTLEYDIAGDRQLIENIMRTFDAELFSRLGGRGHPDNGPIFIIGMPRSGTTLVEQILSAHPDVYGAGEIEDLGRVIRDYFDTSLKSSYPLGIEGMTDQAVRALGEQYCRMLAQYDSNASRITNKMPHNFLYAGMIRLMLPEAKIIHCMRDPLDTCFSCYSINFRYGQAYSYRLDELGRYYGLYERLMQHWRGLPGIDLIEVSYEALINDQEAQTRRLLDACGLDWNDACLDFHKSDRPVMTASVNQVRSGIYNRSVRRWRHFESHLTPLIDALNRPPAQ